jgi:hypothetical protein
MKKRITMISRSRRRIAVIPQSKKSITTYSLCELIYLIANDISRINPVV